MINVWYPFPVTESTHLGELFEYKPNLFILGVYEVGSLDRFFWALKFGQNVVHSPLKMESLRIRNNLKICCVRETYVKLRFNAYCRRQLVSRASVEL